MIDFIENNNSKRVALGTQNVPGLVLERIQLLAQRRIAWLRKIWTGITEKSNGEFNSHTEVDGYLHTQDIPILEKEWYDQDPEMQKVSFLLNKTEEILHRNKASRISILAELFSLNQLETDILHLCLAHSIEPNLSRVFAYLQDNSARNYITESLIAKLFGYGNWILLPASSPIKKWRLITETTSSAGEPTRIQLDPYIKNWLLGLDGIDDALIEFTSLQAVKKPLSQWPIKDVVDKVKRITANRPDNKLRIFIEGSEGSGRKSFAAIIGKKFGLEILAINADRISENRWPMVYMLAQRQAFLSNKAICWYGETMPEKYWPDNISSFYLQFVIGESDESLTANNHFLDLRIALPAISFNERIAIWNKYVPHSVEWPKEEREEMVLRHETTVGQIVSIGKKMTPTIDDAYEALRSDSGRRLGNLAQQMSSNFTFNDLVLSDYTRKGIEDFIFEATDRIQFWEQPNAKRLFPYGRGLIGLFTGSPGTGKTMAAQVIAKALKQELYRIDLSTVVSKYIGESSKNIERILSRAKNMNVILLFDEADTLFGKRTDIKDSHDRYANSDTNYLLQAIESYPGIVILTSNKESNIDTGFTRRLRYVLEFPKPEASQRLLIWKKILGELTDKNTLEKLENELVKLSTLIDITGAQIKQSILSALYKSRKEKSDLNISHILAGLEREMAKEGRGLGKQVQQSFRGVI